MTITLKEAQKGFVEQSMTPYDIAYVLRQAIDLVEQHRWRFIRLMIAEAGFTVSDANGEVNRAKITLSLCAEEATRLVGEMVPFGASPGQHTRLGFTVRTPIGVVCAITPFNSPLNTVLHKIGPALAAGNAIVLKPSLSTPLTAALLCELLIEAGLSPKLLSLVQGGGDTVGNWLLGEKNIGFYTFTGSSRVGRIIQHGAGLRRTQLELGSIASTIVCADVDLDRAIPKIVNAAFRKAGQVCTSVQRLYVEAPIIGQFIARLKKAASQFPAGDPRKEATRVGPMIAESEAVRTERWLSEARDAGASIVCGDKREGAVFHPTVVTDVGIGMKMVDQEIFAPVTAVIPFTELTDAIASANDTPYGLSAGLFTENISKAMEGTKTLRFGTVQINETSSARGDSMPFGGIKDSGYGREGPKYAIKELMEEKLIVFNP